ncbi:GntR family transcriptional regulator [Steroidobacter sp.]|uniref:GntR family transcriptional regulator n=1 Tax=Steroidobacter sp. TaxID=1978227 RepID=UPI001A510696|nr:GntR family transcriptional regulator [Steroidobacter sp.]MBL8269400.1 GntR family transcriptional regulator [Steroidobacter sp.]
MEYQDLRIVENPTLVREHALDKLRNAISRGLYPPGMRLVERELCEALGVSRTSVREALRQLQAENLIEVGKRRNITVAIVSSKDAEDIYLMREMLETLAVKRFVALADENAIKKLVRIHKDLRKVLNKGDVRELAIMAGEFYETILNNSGSKVIADMARQLLTRVNYLRMRSMAEPHRLEDGIHEWDRLIEAIVERNANAAAKAMGDHLANARRAIVAKLQAEEEQAAATAVPVRAAGVRRSG